MQVNILDAKTRFSQLIRLLETKKEQSITIARNGKPVAKLVLYPEASVSNRIGVAKGKFPDPVAFEEYDEEVAALLTGEKL